MEWKHLGSQMTFKVAPSAGKVMATKFWDTWGVILIDYLERGQTVNATLTRLREAIRGWACRAKVSSYCMRKPDFILLKQCMNCCDGSGGTSGVTPPNNPDLAPSDYFLFSR
ncbi:hypothetical protein TNCT_136811 [Trichonephila clavata]|uniref:Uncharacterized protein n=1 Tax=Trichonephila clavata TaxID=2740835 RepID=A0A8X6KAB6_TRICU|nr:hypothetical protein TNCT_136811 [Trichonephila clavata]